jgi:cytochrome c oxidase subunit II
MYHMRGPPSIVRDGSSMNVARQTPAMNAVPSIFDARGVGAERIAVLGWVLTAVAIAVCGIVVAMLLAGVARGRRRTAAQAEAQSGSESSHVRWIVGAGVVAPALVLLGAFVYTLQVQSAVAGPPATPAATIAIIGHTWWWEVHYLGPGGALTANEVHVPVGRPVRLELSTADVIHSFWVPQLAGKTDLIPGQENVTWIEAQRPGTYRAECAEYCGVQHANMDLIVVAEDSADYAAWIAKQAAPAVAPTDSLARAGATVFAAKACAGCHTIRGTAAAGRIGPDLTHLASRSTIAAGMMPNTRGALGGWISNAPAIKPGIIMPPIPMSSGELLALLGYLGTLR